MFIHGLKPRKLTKSSEQVKGYIWLRLVTICNLEVIRRKLYLIVILQLILLRWQYQIYGPKDDTKCKQRVMLHINRFYINMLQTRPRFTIKGSGAQSVTKQIRWLVQPKM